MSELESKLIQDVYPQASTKTSKKRQSHGIKKNISLTEIGLKNKVLANRIHPNEKFELNGFMTFIETDTYIKNDFESVIDQQKFKRLSEEASTSLKVTEKSKVEQALLFRDGYPLMKFRKASFWYWQRLRSICLRTIKHPTFEFASLIVIALNSAFLLFTDPTIRQPTIIDKTSNYFLGFYTLELLMKLIGLNLWSGETAFLKDFWCILDLIVVSTSWMGQFMSQGVSVSSLRSLRVLRPLKSISTIKKLKGLIVTIIESIVFLLDIFVVMLFFFTILAIAGLQLFNGILKNRCVDVLSGRVFYDNNIAGQDFYPGEVPCMDDSVCQSISDNLICKGGFQNPQFGMTHFDNFFNSLLMVWQTSTLEGWSTQYMWLMKSSGSFMKLLTCFFYLLVIFGGSYLILNLVLAVIIVKFNQSQNATQQKVTNITHIKDCICGNNVNFNLFKKKGMFLELSLSRKQNSTISNKKYRYIGYEAKELMKKKFEISNKYSFKFIDKFSLYLYTSKSHQKLQKEDMSPRATQKEETRKTNSKKMKNGIDKLLFTLHPANQSNINKSSHSHKQSRFLPIADQAEDFLFSKKMQNKSPSNQQTKASLQLPFDLRTGIEGNIDIDQLKVTIDKDEFVIDNSFAADVEQLIPKVNSQKQEIQVSKNNEIQNNVQEKDLEAITKKKTFKGAKEKNKNKDISNFSEHLTIVSKQIKKMVSMPPNILQLKLNLCKIKQSNSIDVQQTEVLPQETLLTFARERLAKLLKEKQQIFPIYYSQQRMNSQNKNMDDEDGEERNSNSIISSGKITINNRDSSSNAFKKNTKNQKDQPLLKNLSTIDARFSKTNISLLEQTIQAVKQDYYYLDNTPSIIIPSIQDNPNVQKIDKSIKFKDNDKSKKMNSKFHTKDFQQIMIFFKEDFNDLAEVDEKEQFALNFKKKDIIQYTEVFYDNIYFKDREFEQKEIFVSSISECIEIKQNEENKLELIFNTLNFENHYLWPSKFIDKVETNRFWLRQFFESRIIENLLLAIVVLNTIILSLDGLVTSDSALAIIEIFGSIITWIFIGEAALKVYAYGINKYFASSINAFDFLIVAISLIDLAYSSPSSATGNTSSSSNVLGAIKVIRVLRTFRVLRVTKLLRSLKFMKIIIEVIGYTLEQFMYTGLLLFLFIVIFAMLGMSIYAGTFNFYRATEIPRQNFDSFQWSFITLFQIMTMENWNDVLLLTYRSSVNFGISITYLICWIFLGNFLLLNLFLAILLDGFGNYDLMKKFNVIQNEFVLIDEIIQDGKKDTKLKLEQEKKAQSKEKKLQKMFLEHADSLERFNNQITNNYMQVKEENNSQQESQNSLKLIPEESMDSINEDLEFILQKENNIQKEVDKKIKEVTNETSLFLFSKNHPFRIFCIKIMVSKYFETVILLMIGLSSLKLIIDTYLSKNDSYSSISKNINMVFNILFFFEFLIKIISMGFFFGKKSYLSESWNVLDFLVIVTSFMELIINSANINFVKALRMLRVLRPLRFLSSNKNMKIVVSALLESIGGIANVLIVIVIIWIMFGILGMNLIRGKFGYCSYPDARNYYKINIYQCSNTGGEWTQFGWNFENIINSLITLFILTSGENWPGLMFSAFDSEIEIYGPSYNANFLMYIYYILFVLISSFLLMNLFTGVMFMQFISEQDKEKKKNFKMITDEQFNWIIMQKMIVDQKPESLQGELPDNKFRRWLALTSLQDWFGNIINLSIILNIISMAAVYDGMSTGYSNLLDTANYVFSGIFIIEMIFKLWGFGPKVYFNSGWNQFDFVVNSLSILDIGISNLGGLSIMGSYPQIIRSVRIVRVTRLLKMTKSERLQSINKIIRTLTFAIPALLNVFLLLILIYFIFAILGCFVFPTNINYKDFSTSLNFLFIISTGEDWPTKMFVNSQDNPFFGKVFTIAFIFFSSFIMIQMFCLVVIDQFDNYYFNPDNPVNSFDEIIEDFNRVWQLFSNKYLGLHIRSADLYNLFICLPVPLGFHVPVKNEQLQIYGADFQIDYFHKNLRFDANYVRKRIVHMGIYQDTSGFVSFGQILHATMRNAFGYQSLAKADIDTKQKIRRIELEAIAEIYKKNNPDSAQNQNGQAKKVKISNPFNAVLFSRLFFEIWMDHTKKSNSEKSFSDEDLQEAFTKNPKYSFYARVVPRIKVPNFTNLIYIKTKVGKILKKMRSGDQKSSDQETMAKKTDFQVL